MWWPKAAYSSFFLSFILSSQQFPCAVQQVEKEQLAWGHPVNFIGRVRIQFWVSQTLVPYSNRYIMLMFDQIVLYQVLG